MITIQEKMSKYKNRFNEIAFSEGNGIKTQDDIDIVKMKFKVGDKVVSEKDIKISYSINNLKIRTVLYADKEHFSYLRKKIELDNLGFITSSFLLQKDGRERTYPYEDKILHLKNDFEKIIKLINKNIKKIEKELKKDRKIYKKELDEKIKLFNKNKYFCGSFSYGKDINSLKKLIKFLQEQSK